MKTIGQCKECKFWVDCSIEDPYAYKPNDWGECIKSKYDLSLGKKTMSEFGCIHWEKKEEEHETETT